MTKKKKSRAKPKRLHKKPGPKPAITPVDVQNLVKCFRHDYTIDQALEDTKVKRSTFFDYMKRDPEFRTKMREAKKSAFKAIKSNVMAKAERNPWLGLKVLERREKKDWSPHISHDMKVAPVKIVFQNQSKFFDPSKSDAVSEDDIDDMTDEDLFD